MTTNTPEILIVGAGPVGLTAALELNRRGFHSTIIDNDGTPTPESRALAIHARTLDILEPSGVTEQLLAEGNKVRGLLIREGIKTLLELNFKDIPHRFNFILTLPQSRTEEILIDALKTRGTDVHWFTELAAVNPAREARAECGSRGFICTLNHQQQTRDHKADLLIGADGAHSTVRKQLSMSFDGESLPNEWSLADVEFSDWPHPHDRAVLTLTKAGPVGYFPMGEGYGRLVSSNADLLNHLPPDAAISNIIWQSTFRISYRQVTSYQQGSAFLMGDAAHIHSPAGGRGMNLGIEDAATLAWLIETGKTADYTARRHPIGEKVLKFTRAQTRQFTSKGGGFRFALKYIAPLVMAIPFVRRKAFATLTGLDTPSPEWL